MILVEPENNIPLNVVLFTSTPRPSKKKEI